MACLVFLLYAYLFEGLWVLGLPEGKLNMEGLGFKGQWFSVSLGFSNLPPLPV